MANVENDKAEASRSTGEISPYNDSTSEAMPLSIVPPTGLHESSDEMEDMVEPDMSDSDAESIIGVSMSRAASRMKSPKTPAVEKQIALDEAGGFFESGPESPPTREHALTLMEEDETEVFPGMPTPPEEISIQTYKQKEGLDAGPLPSPNLQDSAVALSPENAQSSPLAIRRSSPPQSSLAGVFGGERKRSLSASAAALKKLLPNGLTSMATVGHFFGSSSGQQRARTLSSSSSKNVANVPSGNSSGSRGSPILSPRTQPFESVETTRPPPAPRQPAAIRRVTSDDSLLYHSLSRTSSLGDDARFENHHDQVNSRVKAIRDSLQDRSSFRLPQLPNLPSMPRVSNFGFNMNFLTSSNVPARWRSDTDVMPDILSEPLAKRKSTISNPAVGPGMTDIAASRPDVAKRTAQTAPESHTKVLDRAMESLVGDIVIMGGYRGSILRSTKTRRQVWVPVKVGLNLRKVDLEVGLEPEDEERMEETIYPSGMLQNIGPVDISKRLFKRLSECENARNGKLRIWDYGYDWRLSPHLLSKKLEAFLEKLPSNQPGTDGSLPETRGALVIPHSLGGLITRHVVNRRPELFSGVIYAGVPQSCVNILGPIRNGDAVLLSSRVLTAQVNFTLRTSFVLLPEDGSCFVDINTKEKYPVDFFNLDDWIKYRFSPCTDPPLPPRNHNTGGLGNLLNLSSAILSLPNLPIPGRKSISGSSSPQPSPLASTHEESGAPSKTTRAADAAREADGGKDRTIGLQMGNMGNNSNPVSKGQNINTSVSTAVTLPRDKAIAYLKRTLAETKKFKQELYFRPEISEDNLYPPLAVIYGKSIPTCCGAKVDGVEGIPCSDSYDNLAFASGDGVCLAKEAMLPEGYKAVYGGRIRSNRGHVTLLGDLNAVGRAIEAVSVGRWKGIGLGVEKKSGAGDASTSGVSNPS
ncbi:Uncharacterized protein D0Z07_6244 [Hyphodiscus hymeniophilus]|uniref:Uncharacterized protein n=1 Tax=Hyphodiscus hymeniophilus TaxID=353542 RepID=A0A9P6VFB9_9HELO|nr:Uncharacterized protein D0Z07_6244 [Hyphodiscus hymeniophilus]